MTSAVLDEINGRKAAALLINGTLEDFLIDPDDNRPRIGAFYRARTNRALKGQGGMLWDLGDGQTGYLRGANGIAQNQMLSVQIASYGEGNKATPVTTRLLFKGHYAIITPDAAGYNIARSIKDDTLRKALSIIAHEAMQNTPTHWGIILRSSAQNAQPDDLRADIAQQLELAHAIMGDNSHTPCLLFEQDAHERAQTLWFNPSPVKWDSGDDAFERHGVLDYLQQLEKPDHGLPDGGSFAVETTKALVAVDVNTGGDFSPNAGMKANLATAAHLPRALRLRGLGGQIVIDFAPFAKSKRRQIEDTLRRAFKTDPVETNLVGWTPLGHFELQRKRERIAIYETDWHANR